MRDEVHVINLLPPDTRPILDRMLLLIARLDARVIALEAALVKHGVDLPEPDYENKGRIVEIWNDVMGTSLKPEDIADTTDETPQSP